MLIEAGLGKKVHVQQTMLMAGIKQLFWSLLSMLISNFGDSATYS